MLKSTGKFEEKNSLLKNIGKLVKVKHWLKHFITFLSKKYYWLFARCFATDERFMPSLPLTKWPQS